MWAARGMGNEPPGEALPDGTAQGYQNKESCAPLNPNLSEHYFLKFLNIDNRDLIASDLVGHGHLDGSARVRSGFRPVRSFIRLVRLRFFLLLFGNSKPPGRFFPLKWKQAHHKYKFSF